MIAPPSQIINWLAVSLMSTDDSVPSFGDHFNFFNTSSWHGRYGKRIRVGPSLISLRAAPLPNSRGDRLLT